MIEKTKPILLIQSLDGQVGGIVLLEDGKQTPLPFQVRNIQRLIEELTDKFEDLYVAWKEIGIEEFLLPVEEWPDFLKHDLEVLHIGALEEHTEAVSIYRYACFDDFFCAPAGSNVRHCRTPISPLAGIAHAGIFRALKIKGGVLDFRGGLIGISLKLQSHGVFPIHEPRLLKEKEVNVATTTSASDRMSGDILTVIRAIHGTRRLIFYLVVRMLSDYVFHFDAVLKMLKRGVTIEVREEVLEMLSTHNNSPEISEAETVDVVIPTLGRGRLVTAVLNQLSNQTKLPQRVIIIEQALEANGVASLVSDDFQQYPFEVILRFTNDWKGACRARNWGIELADAEWILLLDDDIEFEIGFVSSLIESIKERGLKVGSAATYLPTQEREQVVKVKMPSPWPTLGALATALHRDVTESGPRFDLALEGGYGEDFDFGAQLRRAGFINVYVPKSPVKHLKIPSGGFRTDFHHPWQMGKVAPKPSPTVMLSKMKQYSSEMLIGYKYFLLIKRLGGIYPWSWPKAVINWKRQWAESVKWARWLDENRKED